MSTKTVTEDELGSIVASAITYEEWLDDADVYQAFLNDLLELICNYFGGQPADPPITFHKFRYYCHVEHNECVPPNGGIWNDYDPLTTWPPNEHNHESHPD